MKKKLNIKGLHIKGLVFTAFLVIPAIFYLYVGFLWLVSPESGASLLLMPLLSGAGLSSQMGDVGGLFMALGLVVMTAIATRTGAFLLPVAVMMGTAAMYRLLAFMLYQANLLPHFIALEVVLAVWFAIASRRLGSKEANNG